MFFINLESIGTYQSTDDEIEWDHIVGTAQQEQERDWTLGSFRYLFPLPIGRLVHKEYKKMAINHLPMGSIQMRRDS